MDLGPFFFPSVLSFSFFSIVFFRHKFFSSSVCLDLSKLIIYFPGNLIRAAKCTSERNLTLAHRTVSLGDSTGKQWSNSSKIIYARYVKQIEKPHSISRLSGKYPIQVEV